MAIKSKSYENKDTVEALIRLGKIFCVVAITIPIIVILLRLVDFTLLKRFSPGHIVVMNPLSGICFLILSIALYIIREEDCTSQEKSIANILCFISLTITITKILSFILNIDIGIDTFLFREQLILPENPNWTSRFNNMGINTSVGLSLMAVSIIFIDSDQTKLYKSPQTLNYVTIFLALLTIYGYIYDVEDLYVSLGRIPMSFHSALTMLLLSSAVIFLRPHRGTMAYLIGQNPTEVFMMRFLAFIIPLVIGYFKIKAEENHILTSEFGTALMATCTFLISMSLLGWKSNIQYKLQLEKRRKIEIIKTDRLRLEHILDSSKTFIQIVDIDEDKLLFSNETKEDAFVLHKGLIGESFNDLIKKQVHPEDRKAAVKREKKLPDLKKDEHYDLTYRLLDKKGQQKWILSRALVFEKEKDRNTKIMFNAVDITSQKKEEEELSLKNKMLEKKSQDLIKAKEELENANQELEDEIKKHSKELVRAEKKYHDYIRNSFEGILRYDLKNRESIDTSLPIEKQVELIKSCTVIGEANEMAARIHEFDKPDGLVGMTLSDYLSMPNEKVEFFIKKFITSGYRLHNIETRQVTQNGSSIKVISNLIGVVKNNKLINAWGVQTSHKEKVEL